MTFIRENYLGIRSDCHSLKTVDISLIMIANIVSPVLKPVKPVLVSRRLILFDTMIYR